MGNESDRHTALGAIGPHKKALGNGFVSLSSLLEIALVLGWVFIPFWDIFQPVIGLSQKRIPMKSVFTKEYSAFLEVLIAARTSQNLTQAAVAERLKKHQSFVSKYETGERRIDVVEFFDIAKALNKDPIILLKEMGFIQ